MTGTLEKLHNLHWIATVNQCLGRTQCLCISWWDDAFLLLLQALTATVSARLIFDIRKETYRRGGGTLPKFNSSPRNHGWLEGKTFRFGIRWLFRVELLNFEHIKQTHSWLKVHDNMDDLTFKDQSFAWIDFTQHVFVHKTFLCVMSDIDEELSGEFFEEFLIEETQSGKKGWKVFNQAGFASIKISLYRDFRHHRLTDL